MPGAGRPDQGHYGPGGAAEGTLEPIGVYVFSPDVLSSIPARSYQDIKESLIPRLRARGERVMMHVVADGVSPRVADAQSYQRVNMWVVERILAGGDPPHGYVRVGDAFGNRPLNRVEQIVVHLGAPLAIPGVEECFAKPS